MSHLFTGEHEVFLPYSVFTDTLCRLYGIFKRNGLDPHDAVEILDTLRSEKHITWVEIDKEFAYQAGMFGSLHNLRGPDALIAYTAFKYDCELITTDDDYFDSVSAVLRVCHLGDSI